MGFILARTFDFVNCLEVGANSAVLNRKAMRKMYEICYNENTSTIDLSYLTHKP